MNEPIPIPAEPRRETKQSYIVRELGLADVSQVEHIARQWVRFPPETGPIIEDEVQEILDHMQESIAGQNDRHYFVATSNYGEVLGFVCVAELDQIMLQFVTTPKPVELKNLYVDQDKRKGKGVGRTLYSYAKQWAKENGYTELVLNSGPRYKDTGWPFYEKVIGPPYGTAKALYDGHDAPVWREEL